MQQGLAASVTQPQQAPGSEQGQMPSVDEVVALLMQGVPPEKLEEMGVLPEVIMQAIEILEQQMAAEQQQQAAPPQQMGGGLAQSMVGQ